MSEPTATQIIAGPATLYIAAVGTALPATSSPATFPPVWPAGWQQVGYTEKGVDLIYTPTIKGLTPDEEASEVYDILEKQKAEVSTVLWEATFENYKNMIAAAATTDDGAVRKVGLGGLTLNYTAIGFQGPAPVSDDMSSPASFPTGRVIILQKAIVTSAVSLNMSRQDIQKFTVKFEARKIAGQDLYDLFEFYHH
jgi:hypothetical protein